MAIPSPSNIPMSLCFSPEISGFKKNDILQATLPHNVWGLPHYYIILYITDIYNSVKHFVLNNIYTLVIESMVTFRNNFWFQTRIKSESLFSQDPQFISTHIKVWEVLVWYVTHSSNLRSV